MSKINNIEDVISFFLRSETSDLADNLPFRPSPSITSVSQAIGIIVKAIADAKAKASPTSSNPLYEDAYYMAIAIIAKREANAPRSFEDLRKLLGTIDQVKTREWSDRDDI